MSVAIDQLQEQLTDTPIKIILNEARTKKMEYELAIERVGMYQKFLPNGEKQALNNINWEN